MAENPKAAAPDAPESQPKTKPKVKRVRLHTPEREQSTIQFPYMDLENAMAVASAILRGGGVAVTRDQLAGLMNLVAGSGNFVQKVAAARIFGLLIASGGKYELTHVGFNILDSDEARQKAARRDAFLTVPLYRRVFDEFRGKQLPPRPHGLEQAFTKFGVAPKQKTNARLAFDKSASQAGFFMNGPERLIEPIVGSPANRGGPVEELEMADDPNTFANPKNKQNRSGFHPFIQGLLDTLPEPATNWTVEGRAKWLQAAANIFDLIYQGSGEIDIKAKSGDASA